LIYFMKSFMSFRRPSRPLNKFNKLADTLLSHLVGVLLLGELEEPQRYPPQLLPQPGRDGNPLAGLSARREAVEEGG
jgi:hypothetical protein